MCELIALHLSRHHSSASTQEVNWKFTQSTRRNLPHFDLKSLKFDPVRIDCTGTTDSDKPNESPLTVQKVNEENFMSYEELIEVIGKIELIAVIDNRSEDTTQDYQLPIDDEDNFYSSDSLTDMALDSELSAHEGDLEGVDSEPFIQQTNTVLLRETGLSDNLLISILQMNQGFNLLGPKQICQVHN